MRARVEVLVASPAPKSESAPLHATHLVITDVTAGPRLILDDGGGDDGDVPVRHAPPPLRSSQSPSSSSSSVSSSIPSLPPAPALMAAPPSPRIRTKITAQPRKPAGKKRPAAGAPLQGVFDDWPDAKARKVAAVSKTLKSKPTSTSLPPPPSLQSDKDLQPVTRAFSVPAAAPPPPVAACFVHHEDPVEPVEAPATPERRPQMASTGSSDKGHRHASRSDASHKTGLLALFQDSQNGLKQALMDLVAASTSPASRSTVDALRVCFTGRAVKDEAHWSVGAFLGDREVTLLVRSVFDGMAQQQVTTHLKRLKHVGFEDSPSAFAAGTWACVHAPFKTVGDDIVLCVGLVRLET